MSQDVNVMSKLILTLMTLHQRKASGELIIALSHNPSTRWHVYLYLGRVVYARGGRHPVRRWYRALRHHCPEYAASEWVNDLPSHSELWEVDTLNQAVLAGHITALQAREVVRQIVQEVFISFIERPALTTQWHAGKQVVEQGAFLSLAQMVKEAQLQRNEWHASGLGHLQELLSKFSPDLAPIVRNQEQLRAQVAPQSFNMLNQLMQGKRTLWDLGLAMNKPLPNLMRSLLPLIRQGVISLREIPDLPSPFQPPPPPEPPQPKVEVPKPLIACIDDSSQVHDSLRKILEPQGYEVMVAEDPLHSIGLLLAKKPALIILDLVMPSTNGYELCNFLRKTTQFNKVPILVLTSHDKMVERMRAKQVGATEFLSKPPEPDRLLEVVQRLLKNSPTQELVHA